MLQQHTLTKYQRIERLHAVGSLGSRRPSQLLFENDGALSWWRPEASCFFVFLFLQRLPAWLRVQLESDDQGEGGPAGPLCMATSTASRSLWRWLRRTRPWRIQSTPSGETTATAVRAPSGVADTRATSGIARRRSKGRRRVTLQPPPTGSATTTGSLATRPTPARAFLLPRRSYWVSAWCASHKLLVDPAANCPTASSTAPPLHLHCRLVLHRRTSSLPVVWFGTIPHPHTRSRVCPPFGSEGRYTVHTRLRERGRGVPIRTWGQTLWYSRYICTLCVRSQTQRQPKKWGLPYIVLFLGLSSKYTVKIG